MSGVCERLDLPFRGKCVLETYVVACTHRIDLVVVHTGRAETAVAGAAAADGTVGFLDVETARVIAITGICST